MNFMGYRRPDGKAGIRNKVLILPTCACSSETSRIVAEQVEGAIYVSNQAGCSEVEQNLKICFDMYSGFAANPNIYGTVLIGLGCEGCTPDKMADAIREKTNKPLEIVVIQDEGGTVNAITKAVKYARRLAQEASLVKKEEIPVSELFLGLECGGSDATSGLAANPVVGKVSDLLVDNGGSAVMSETTEFIGAEHILAKRAATPEIKKQIIGICKGLEEHLANVNQNLRTGQPTPGNKDGGISTIEEKSLGCIYKGGTRPIVEVLDYAQMPTKKGALIMDTPGFDVASVTAMVAGGCQVVIFTTGRGTPTGNIIAPVIKVTGNSKTYEKMSDNIDFDASVVLTGEKSIDERGEELFNELLEVANGKVTKAEAFGFNECSMNRICKFI
ncbi:UxaA family hydrolase [Lachnospiraceae bacterium NSJ-143]|nr:UxaA family hydrolase [Lachnospiraceae bacterium NSJ-143]